MKNVARSNLLCLNYLTELARGNANVFARTTSFALIICLTHCTEGVRNWSKHVLHKRINASPLLFLL